MATPQLPMDDIDESTPGRRRTTRSALAELMSTTLPTTPSVSHGVTWSMNLPSSLLTPSPSPDELVIQQRGRRKIPATWSPDVKERRDRTPVKLSSPSKSTIVLRSTPRKRLLMVDPRDPPSPEKTPRKMSRMAASLNNLAIQCSPATKKSRQERPSSGCPTGPLSIALKGLSSEQLVEMIVHLTQTHPELEQEVREALPAPDLRPVEEELSYLKTNIFKAIPSSRLTGKTDSPAYNRASTHVKAFKKSVLQHGRQLVDSQNWSSVMEYVFLAWSYTRCTPLWENPPHNCHRRQCFKALASHCHLALKKGTFTPAEYQRYTEKLEGFIADSEDVQNCLKQLQVISNSKPSTPTKTQ